MKTSRLFLHSVVVSQPGKRGAILGYRVPSGTKSKFIGRISVQVKVVEVEGVSSVRRRTNALVKAA